MRCEEERSGIRLRGQGAIRQEGEERVKMTHSISLHSERPLIKYSHDNDSTEEASCTLLLETRYLPLFARLYTFFLATSVSGENFIFCCFSSPPLLSFFSHFKRKATLNWYFPSHGYSYCHPQRAANFYVSENTPSVCTFCKYTIKFYQ